MALTAYERARQVVDQGLLRQDQTYPEVWWVQASGGRTEYRVQMGDGFFTCTCPHGLHKGGGDPRCYHVAAVKIALEEGTR